LPGSDLDLLIDAARASGDIARKHFQSDPQVWDKDGGAGPVTEADLEIDTMLRTELLAARATYGWLSEETEDDAARLDHERVFIVDPIDGTRAFIEGKHHFSHSLAIAENGVVTTAVVYLPMMDKLYAATDQTAATMNGEAIAPSTRAELDGATLLATKNNLKDEHWQGGTPPFEHRFRPSLAYRLCLVAEGRFDAMLTCPMLARDTDPCGAHDMAQRLHLVFGGELIDPTKNAFKDVEDIHIVGMFPDYATAYNAWKEEAQRTVDNAHMRYFIAHIHRLRDEETEVSPTEELDG